jgi:hypothetical protein
MNLLLAIVTRRLLADLGDLSTATAKFHADFLAGCGQGWETLR